MEQAQPGASTRRVRRAAVQDHRGTPLLTDGIALLAEAADRAPSPVLPRPWRLRARGGAVELLADLSSLARGPEQLRQAVIACGAALFNLRLATAHLGVRADVTLLPDAAQPDLLARVAGGPAEEPDAVDEQLYVALTARRTQRAPFVHPFVPREVLDHLAAGVRREDACLVAVADPRQLRVLDDLMERADHRPELVDRPRAPWVPGGGGSVELLVTDSDSTPDWLRAGMALQRLLLTATTLWLGARFHTRVLELTDLRDEVRRAVCPGGHPQVVLELGQWDAA
jgi:hypothetical protein